MAARLIVPAFGTTRAKAEELRGTDAIRVDVRVSKATLIRNDHHTADTLHLQAAWQDCGVDPRLLKHAICYFWLEHVQSGDLDITQFNPRFVGVATKVGRASKEGDGFSVEMEFHDYTQFFLACKPFSSDGVPTFSMTLKEAWKKICAYTGWFDKVTGGVISNVEVLADRLSFDRILDADVRAKVESLTFGDAVTGRLKTLGHIPAQHGQSSNAWDVWQHACQMVGLISYIDGDQCFVTTTTEHYSNEEAPVLIWGNNLLDWDESANTALSGTGICLQSFDPLTGKIIEAFYPPPDDKRIYHKRSVVNAKNYDPNNELPVSDQYDFFEYHQVTDPGQLQIVAQAAYEERARQELEGMLKTSEVFVQSNAGQFVNVLDLHCGDTIKVVIDPLDKALLRNEFNSENDRVVYLMSQGYSSSVAALIAHNLDSLDQLDGFFHLKQIQVDFGELEFSVEMRYHNLISLEGVFGTNTK